MYRDNKLDDIDLTILEILQKHGRTRRNEIAEIVGLSLPAVSERVLKLEDQGYIKSFHAHLDNHKVGLGVTALIFITTESSTYYPDILERANANENIQECHTITGIGSHILKVRAEDMKALEKILNQVQAWPGVKDTTTNIVLSTIKETTILPVRHLKKKVEQV
ncbi:MAG: Lrp/AsnC family transcriptional regulator [Calditrichae bacterium]|nr:Lrp/AsnC family transcriptional regulator [Calditrichota bacterium]MCB9058986.1 Lrp/AsnC family transcriptional regulator [Calditrichia bacterium]